LEFLFWHGPCIIGLLTICTGVIGNRHRIWHGCAIARSGLDSFWADNGLVCKYYSRVGLNCVAWGIGRGIGYDSSGLQASLQNYPYVQRMKLMWLFQFMKSTCSSLD
jgi:hypothetical protein